METRVNQPVPNKVSCNDCSLSAVCLPLAVDVGELEQLDNIILRGRMLNSGEHRYRAADNFESVYAVRSGAMKTFVLLEMMIRVFMVGVELI